MTDEEKAEEYIKNEVCIKLCPTWKANGEKCDLFPQCHYISSKIKYYRLGLAEGRKEGYEKGLDTFPNTRKENRVLKEQNKELIDKLNLQNQRLNELKKENERLQKVILEQNILNIDLMGENERLKTVQSFDGWLSPEKMKLAKKIYERGKMTDEEIEKLSKERKMKNLEETIDLMKSNDYKERFIAEYWQLKIRYDKLTNFVAKIEIAEIKGETPPKHDCPLSLLRMQKKYMGEYLVTLEARAKIENINL